MINVPYLRGVFEIEHLLDLIERTHSYICGGYARYMCSPLQKPVPAGDVDIFPRDKDSLNQNKDYLIYHLGYSVKAENDNAITLNNPVKGIYAYSPIAQLIKPVNEGRVLTTGSLEKILENFDFSVVKIGTDGTSYTSGCLADDDFLEDELNHKLVFRNIHCPISSLLRATKYAKKGYYLSPSESLKLFLDWDSRTPEYRKRLTDLFGKSATKDEEGNSEISQEEVDELERLMRID